MAFTFGIITLPGSGNQQSPPAKSKEDQEPSASTTSSETSDKQATQTDAVAQTNAPPPVTQNQSVSPVVAATDTDATGSSTRSVVQATLDAPPPPAEVSEEAELAKARDAAERYRDVATRAGWIEAIKPTEAQGDRSPLDMGEPDVARAAEPAIGATAYDRADARLR